MKKKFLFIVTLITMFVGTTSIHACGNITELKSSIGTVSQTDSMKYVVTVPKGTSTVTLTGTTDSEWVSGFGPRTVSVNNGFVLLKVDGKSCNSGIYNYTVEFKEMAPIIAENTQADEAANNEGIKTEDEDKEPSNDQDADIEEPNYGVLTLSSLKIADIDFEFKPDEHVYNLTYESNATKIKIDPKTEESDATVEVSDIANDLKDGLNKITVSLADPYGNTGLYVLNITKEKPKSPNNYLTELKVENYQLNFDSSVTNYSLQIKKESSLNITYTKESETSAVSILGNSNLMDNSNITVRVTAQNGDVRDYVINVTRGFDIMDYWIYIVVVVLIIILIILLVISKKKKKKNGGKMEPQEVAKPEVTAGVIEEVVTQNKQEASEKQSEKNAEAPVALAGNTVPLKIIEPSNVDATKKNDDENKETEVFQL